MGKAYWFQNKDININTFNNIKRTKELKHLLHLLSGNYCWRGTSTGVDLNRNFDWNFGGAHGSSRDPKDEEYRGAYAFSGMVSHNDMKPLKRKQNPYPSPFEQIQDDLIAVI